MGGVTEWPARVGSRVLGVGVQQILCGRRGPDGRYVCQGDVGSLRAGVVEGPVGGVPRDDGTVDLGSQAQRDLARGTLPRASRRWPKATSHGWNPHRRQMELPYRTRCPHCGCMALVDARVLES